MIASGLQEGRVYRTTVQNQYYGAIAILLEIERDPHRLKFRWFWPELDLLTRSDWSWRDQDVSFEDL